MHNEEIFSTRDLTMAATLVTLKFPMVGVDYQIDGTQANPVGYFKFEESQDLKDARQKYTQSLISVEPKMFVTNIRSLKAEVTNAFRNPHKNVLQ